MDRLQHLAFTAVKSRLGHTETGAGVQGMHHAWWQLSQATTPNFTHLRTINAYVASSLKAASVPAHLPRQTAPAPACGQHASEGFTAVSSFAFQASVMV